MPMPSLKSIQVPVWSALRRSRPMQACRGLNWNVQYSFLFLLTVMLFMQRASSQEFDMHSCPSDETMVGSLDGMALCFKRSKAVLLSVRYEFRAVGMSIDFVKTDDLLAKLARAAHVDIAKDANNPNFLLLIIDEKANVDFSKELAIVGVKYNRSDIYRLQKEVEGFQKTISGYFGDPDFDSASYPLVLTGRDSAPAYVDVMVRKRSKNYAFFPSDVRGAVMQSLGLTFGKRDQ